VDRLLTPFDRDTTLTPLGGGRFGVTISGDWWVVVGPNGGLVAAVLLRAAEAAVAEPQRIARSLTVHFVTPPTEGPAELQTTVERAGRAVSFVSVRLTQDGRLRALALVALGAPRPEPLAFQHVAAPRLPPPEQCPRFVSGDSPALIRDRWESRWAIGWLPGGDSPPPQGAIEHGGWIRLAEPHPYDAAVLAAMSDAWVPPLLTRPDLANSGVPTVELTIHFLDRAAAQRLAPDSWCIVAFVTDTATDGFLTEEGRIWSSEGALLAHSRQLAILTPFPEGRTPPSLTLEREPAP
jgi:acyl-CoA thioesterase